MATIHWIAYHFHDHRRDTLNFSALERGAYEFLKEHYLDTEGEPIPADDLTLSRIAKITIKKWREMRAKLESLFEVSTNESGKHFWCPIRTDAELANASFVLFAKQKGGAEGARRRKDRNGLPSGKPTGSPTRKPNGSPATQSHSTSTSPLSSNLGDNSPPAREADVVPAAGGSGRQRAGSALPPPPAGEGADPQSTAECIKATAASLTDQRREPGVADAPPNLSAGFRPADAKDRRIDAALAHVYATRTGENVVAAIEGLSGLDCDHWLEHLEAEMSARQPYAEAAE